MPGSDWAPTLSQHCSVRLSTFISYETADKVLLRFPPREGTHEKRTATKRNAGARGGTQGTRKGGITKKREREREGRRESQVGPVRG